MPALFIGHGSPMNAIEDNPWSREWAALADELPWPNAILSISAHWETQGIAVTIDEAPETIHDFGGFPKALFDVRYPTPGSPALAARVSQLLAPRAVRPALDWGLDHGTWSVLARMYPQAETPVVQLSLDRSLTPEQHYEIGQALKPLRDEGVLVMGSGDIVHNLRAADFRRPEAPDWARRFNDEAKRLILAEDHLALAHYETLGQDAALSINSAEHYLPLLYTLGMRDRGESVRFVNDEVFAALSMTSVVVG
jgi:4,5-DOPA dioxygenase extradiol